MIQKISCFLTDILSNHITINEKERDIYEYCIRIVLKRSLFLVILMLFGIITGQIGITLLYIVSFMPLRSYCGGAHAPTPALCYLLSYGISIAVLSLIPLFTSTCPPPLILILFLFFCIPIIILSPVDTENKRISPQNKRVLKTKSILLIVCDAILFIVFSFLRIKIYCMTLSICVMICSINVLIGFFQNRRIS
ncbi:MAG: accessory gene regulator B family protein [Lachnospiraceae bacterium]|nr:accessory gene regulator B family protein [Lachnospiraceae bacterium]